MMEQLKNRLWQKILGPGYSRQIFGGGPIRPGTEEWRGGPNRPKNVSSIACKGLHRLSPNFSWWLCECQGMLQDGHTPTRPDLGRIGRKQFLSLLDIDCTD